jgi:GH15 family glucan-1,4-alpha-glucosidase
VAELTDRIVAGDPLAARSVAVLIEGQAPSGGFVASPNFPTYAYAWLRDGAFCAHALDMVGERAHAAAFHAWSARTVLSHGQRFESAIERIQTGEKPHAEDMPPTRYTLDGELEPHMQEPWPNFQLDGYGCWLWSLARHRQDGAEGPLREAADLVARYLSVAWKLECWDCWEEPGDGQHASTLAAVSAGLHGAAQLLDKPQYRAEATRIRRYLLRRFIRDGVLRKGARDDRVDASLLWVALPFNLLDPNDPRMRATALRIRSDLVGRSGGVYRYLGDTYYGGGEWLLLTAWLAWYDAVIGDVDAFERGRRWVISQARDNDDLPEQVVHAAQVPALIEEWVRRWGPVAAPLLWSHAMYLIMSAA